MEGKVFSVELGVRDYELDMFGVVNNSVYQNYFEHTRHLFLPGIINDLTRRNETAVISEIKIKYKRSLRSQDRFMSNIRLKRKGNVRVIFLQDLFLKGTNEPVACGEVTCVFLNSKGVPITIPQDVLDLMEPYFIA